MSHLQEQELLSKKQYDFSSGRSTTIKLLNYLDQCIQTIVGGVVGRQYDFTPPLSFRMRTISVGPTQKKH